MKTGSIHLASFLVGLGRLPSLGGIALLLLGWFASPAHGASGSPPEPAKASIRILEPASGDRFFEPGRVIIEAQAVDPAGDIRHLEFFANGSPIGVSDFLLKIATIPGRPIPHRLEWDKVAAGSYDLVARGKDTQGNAVESAPVSIRVVSRTGVTDRPLVTLEVTRGATSEPRPEARIAPGLLTLHRTGDDSRPLAVYLKIGGSATPGKDYEPLPDVVKFPEGKSNLELAVVAWDDDVVEGEEVVSVELVPPPPSGLVPAYTLDPEKVRGEVTIADADVPKAAHLAIVEPKDGAVLPEGQVITIKALAVDPAGYLPRVEFFDGDQSIGVSELTFIREPDPGTPLMHSLDWKGATPGVHKLTARVLDSRSDRQLISEPVVITVGPPLPQKPSLVIDAPKDGASFPAGADIKIHATAIDPNGYIARVVFFDGDERIGVSEIAFITAPPPGTPIEHEFVWKDASNGRHRLTAHAIVEQDMAILSDPVLIVVGEPTSKDPTLVIDSPKSGDNLPAGQLVTIHAVAIDPASYISRVEFFDGDLSLGVSEITFIRAPDPGTPIEHSLEWKDPQPGSHRLVARAISAAGNKVESDPVDIRVGGEDPPVVVLALEAADPEAAEAKSGVGADPGKFVLRRVAGPAEVGVKVQLHWGGSADNGVDYETLPDVIELPGGVDRVDLEIRPLSDNQREGAETVVLKLQPIVCPAIFPPPPYCYQISGRDTAVVTIRDGLTIKNEAPEVALVSPKSGTVFALGAPITIEAKAADSDGKIATLEILADGKVIGTAPEGSLKVEWASASEGNHKLSAHAVDDLGGEASTRVVVINVRDARTEAVAQRDLPPAYVPSQLVTVVIAVEPPRGAGAWVLEEIPPTGWAISNITEDGVLDTVSGKVKFGPYTDSRARSLSYQVLPPADAQGVFKFEGALSVDGKTSPVGGELALEPVGEFHPADLNPQDHAITADELTAYAAAWKNGTPWTNDLSAIPVSFVTRAGLIWRQGEKYVFDLTKGAPPECWSPAGAAPASGRTLAGLRPAGDHGKVDRDAASLWKPGKAGEVTVTIVPPAGTSAWAVEEIIPVGWRIAAVSDGGVFDAETRRLRWGLFFGDATRRLQYTAVPPSEAACTARFEGTVSFDGKEVAIGGLSKAGASDATTELRITGSRHEGKGKSHFQISAAPDQVFVVEASSDLQNWEEVEAFVFTGDEIQIDDTAAPPTAPGRYYRLRPVGR